ncbi:alkaline phosphatase family protein [Patulibacter americanus]|uniref:alkaline phosphatase family protein n=1 Tax=Patulibacter americanus TaxID=588672 RepID=UPI0003B60818|nr:alkaline phosphatase family protein [Patulibacter americanus]
MTVAPDRADADRGTPDRDDADRAAARVRAPSRVTDADRTAAQAAAARRAGPDGRRRLVFAVVDGCSPPQLRRAIDEGRAPMLARAVEEGRLHESVAAFPSVTPVCATALATGVRQDRHRIPSINWWDRSRGRYVEYGSSFSASRRLGIARQLADVTYHLNGRHLAPEVPTVFESLDDAGVRTAGTTFLITRGRYRHAIARDRTMTKLAASVFRAPIMGPRELFFADLVATRDTPCRSRFGHPGMRDQHAGCVSAHLVEHDLADFILLSLPDNDTHSHKHGPEAQIDSIALADEELRRVIDAAGGPDRFFAEWALVVASDHGHTLVERAADPRPAFEPFGITGPKGPGKKDRIAYSPASRAAMVYVLDPLERPSLLPQLVDAGREAEGVELVIWREDDGTAVIASGSESAAIGELRFRKVGEGDSRPVDVAGTGRAPQTEPDGWRTVRDQRGGTWQVAGDLDVVGATVQDGVLSSASHPDPLGRCWSALTCVNSGDLLLSASAGVEFPDWGGVHHLGGGSHGSLRADDAVGILIHTGLHDQDDPRGRPELDPGAWSIEDATPLILRHFGATPAQTPA